MSLHFTGSGPHGHATLEGELTIPNVGTLRDELAAACAAGDQIDIDLSGVTEIDTAGLQWMLMAKRVPDTAVRFVNHSPAVMRMLELSHMEHALDAVLASSETDPS